MVYLLHLSPAYKRAKHYLGYTSDVPARVALHKSGRGARLCQVAVDAGCELVLVRTWKGGRKEERKLKNLKNAPRLCPLCLSAGKIGAPWTQCKVCGIVRDSIGRCNCNS